MSRASTTTLALVYIFVTLAGSCSRATGGALQEAFYKGKCRTADVEVVVGGVIRAWFSRDPTIAAALLRMQFHDCFVNGCDASILLDGKNTEKTAVPNLSVRGYEIIDAAKAVVDSICPGVVSCADIIVMATRDAVALSGGGRYIVQTGRRDGTVSLAKNVNLPAPSITVSDSIKAFSKKGLDSTDMVYLLGGHTVGIAHCSLFRDRLYNFQNTGKADPTMDSTLLNTLKARCPQNSTVDNTVNLDQNPLSSMTVDNSYYRQIILHRGILQIDQELALDPLTNPTVTAIAKGFNFSTGFGQAMVKLGAVEVLTGTQGEIRRSCRAIN
ncbi:Peroxidase 60 [Forsythia ovata]|uniref:Peroxidase n=1 Tax=Forsythia ovata TaxID=205694 RepID=A0ABD1T2P6_9LAMI